MKRVYIAGRISGQENTARLRFAAAEEHLRAAGYDPVNPMKLPHDHDKRWTNYMRECLRALLNCDAIWLLEDWEDSPGARMELELAGRLGMPILIGQPLPKLMEPEIEMVKGVLRQECHHIFGPVETTTGKRSCKKCGKMIYRKRQNISIIETRKDHLKNQPL